MSSLGNQTIDSLVHLRNIDASDLEIVQLGLSFGRITNVLNLRKKNQVSLFFEEW